MFIIFTARKVSGVPAGLSLEIQPVGAFGVVASDSGRIFKIVAPGNKGFDSKPAFIWTVPVALCCYQREQGQKAEVERTEPSWTTGRERDGDSPPHFCGEVG